MAGGWCRCHCLSSKSHLLQMPWACAEWMHQGAAHLHDFQWGPSQAKVQSVNSIGTVIVMVLLPVDTIVFYRLPVSSATYPPSVLSVCLSGGGRLCTYCSAPLALYSLRLLRQSKYLGSPAALALSYNHGFSCYLPSESFG